MAELRGLHDREGASTVPAGGFCLDTVALSEGATPPAYDTRINWIVRLNWGYGSTGTFPLDKGRYVDAAVEYILNSPNAHAFILGNEPNHEQERPDGKVLTPEYVAGIIADVVGRTSAPILNTPIAPYHASPVDWLRYLEHLLVLLAGSRVKLAGVALHAYTRTSDPKDIGSTAQMGPPLAGQYSGFRTYQDALSVVPSLYRGLPAYITEFNELLEGGWENRNTGVVQAAFREIGEWNAGRGNQQIKALCLYRWPRYDKWFIEGKEGVIEDFKAVSVVPQPPTGEEPTVPKPPSVPSTPQGATVVPVPEGTTPPLWKVSDLRFYNERESQGRHHLYVDVFDEGGERVYGKKVLVSWPNGNAEVITERKTGDLFTNSGNFPFTPGRGAFTAVVVDGKPSEVVVGLGMGEETPSGFNAGVHTSWYVAWKLSKVTTGTPPTPKPVMPTLIHPVSVTQHQRITQYFGENPDFYKRFTVSGVPLKGHNGLDFGTPTGTPILSCAPGQVVEVAEDPLGYGKYVKLQHPWGQSLYAHLSEWAVSMNQEVGSGAYLGKSGNTGISSGPHLHFGLRVNPFNRADGWGGYTDPLPYLRGQTPPVAENLVALAKQAAEEFGVDWKLFASLVQAESSFNPLADSGYAKGLAQIGPATWLDWAGKVGAVNIFDAEDNLRVGAAYLDFLTKYYQGDLRKALWAYNAGPGNVDKGVVPDETKDYANRVLFGRDLLKKVGVS